MKYYLKSVFVSAAFGAFLCAVPSVWAYQILIDVNQLGGQTSVHADEILYNAILRSDGVWAQPAASTSPYMNSSDWNAAFSNLGAASHAIAEQQYSDIGISDNVGRANAFGANISQICIYDESGGRSGNFQLLDNVLSAAEVASANASYGSANNIVVLARSYGGGGIYPNLPSDHTGTWSDGVVAYPIPPLSGGIPTSEYRGWYVDAALAQSSCSGVAFEMTPGESSMWNQNFNAGISHCLNLGKKCYILLPGGNGYDYVGSIMSAMQYFDSNVLSSSNLYFVVAGYARQDSNVGFLYPDAGWTARNSILAAVTWLKAFRASGYQTNLTSQLVSGNSYRLVSMNSGKVAEVDAGATSDGASVKQYGFDGSANQSQVWTAYDVGGGYWRFVNANSGKSLEVGGYSTADGGTVQQWTWQGHDWQKWSVALYGEATGCYIITNKGSGKVLDVSGISVDDGADIWQWGEWSGPNQRWALIPVN